MTRCGTKGRVESRAIPRCLNFGDQVEQATSGSRDADVGWGDQELRRGLGGLEMCTGPPSVGSVGFGVWS